jgi:hypothetical protein
LKEEKLKEGKLSEEDKQRERTPEFEEVRKWHSGIESAIHALATVRRAEHIRNTG